MNSPGSAGRSPARSRRLCLGAASVALLAAAPAVVSSRAQAQDQAASKDRLSLTVRGKASAMADEVAIELTISGSAEESAEAEKKYRDKLNRVKAALSKTDVPAPGDDDASPRRVHKKKPKADAEAPKKRHASDDSDDDDAPPPVKKHTKKKPAADDDDDAPPPAKKKKPAASDDDDDDDDAPRSTKKKDEAPKPEKKTPKDSGKKSDEAPAPSFPFEVKEGGLSFGVKGSNPQQAMLRRMGQAQVKDEPEFRFSSTLTVIYRNVAKADQKDLRREIASMLDRVSDAGADTATSAEGDGTPPVVRFAVSDAEDLKAKAYADAMAAARKRGTNLAALADRTLGKVVAVRDQTALPQSARKQVYNPYQYNYSYQVTSQLGEDWSTEVVMEVDLYVEFELKDKQPATTEPKGK